MQESRELAMPRTSSTGRSLPGQSSETNEDSFLADDGMGLYLVCDGASTEPAGEIASAIARDTLTEHIRTLESQADSSNGIISTESVAEGIHRAFEAVFANASASPSLAGMKTTLTMLLIRGMRAIVGHAGDSRLYVVRDDELHQLTIDHPLARHISGAAGDFASSEVDEVDTFDFLMQTGDVFLLCTDGLNPVLEDEAWIVDMVARQSVTGIADRLLERELALGVTSDATAVVVRVEEGLRPVFLHALPESRLLHHVVPCSVEQAG